VFQSHPSLSFDFPVANEDREIGHSRAQ